MSNPIIDPKEFRSQIFKKLKIPRTPKNRLKKGLNAKNTISNYPKFTPFHGLVFSFTHLKFEILFLEYIRG